VKIGAGGGVEAIVQAMGGHRGSEGVQENGCDALKNLAVNADKNVKIGVVVGVEAIVQAMGGHRGSVHVLEKGCGALWNLAVNADNAVTIGAEGGVEAIVQAMGGHRGSKEVQEKGCGALWNLGQSNGDIQQRIKRVGAEEAVQRATASPDARAWTKEQGQALFSVLRNA
jgi:hypothetical protein